MVVHMGGCKRKDCGPGCYVGEVDAVGGSEGLGEGCKLLSSSIVKQFTTDALVAQTEGYTIGDLRAVRNRNDNCSVTETVPNPRNRAKSRTLFRNIRCSLRKL